MGRQTWGLGRGAIARNPSFTPCFGGQRFLVATEGRKPPARCDWATEVSNVWVSSRILCLLPFGRRSGLLGAREAHTTIAGSKDLTDRFDVP